MLGNLDAPTIIAHAIALIIALSLHELAHAVVADQLGDDTPRRMGRITLNPLAHLDPLGSLMFIVVGFGWAKPVLSNPYHLRNGPRVGMALVAAAGPICNLLQAAIAAIPFRFGLLEIEFSSQANSIGGILPSLEFLLTSFIISNVFLTLFNLLPIGPLDGMKVLRGFSPRAWDRILDPLEQWGTFILLALVFLGQGLLSVILGGPASLILGLLLGR
jgi:Zn-dependent protease